MKKRTEYACILTFSFSYSIVAMAAGTWSVDNKNIFGLDYDYSVANQYLIGGGKAEFLNQLLSWHTISFGSLMAAISSLFLGLILIASKTNHTDNEKINPKHEKLFLGAFLAAVAMGLLVGTQLSSMSSVPHVNYDWILYAPLLSLFVLVGTGALLAKFSGSDEDGYSFSKAIFCTIGIPSLSGFVILGLTYIQPAPLVATPSVAATSINVPVIDLPDFEGVEPLRIPHIPDSSLGVEPDFSTLGIDLERTQPNTCQDLDESGQLLCTDCRDLHLGEISRLSCGSAVKSVTHPLKDDSISTSIEVYADARLEISGTAPTNQLIAEFLSNLEQSEHFTEVYLTAVEQIEQGGVRLKSFTITAQLLP